MPVLCALAWFIMPTVALAQAKAPQPAPASAGTGFDLGNSKNPTAIEADQGIEWQQSNHVYIARGNAKVKRGNSTVVADTLTAHYRPAAKSGLAGTAAPAPPSDAGKENALEGGTEIYRVDADGHVHFFSETQNVYGEHAIYDIDKGTLVVTGDDLKLVTKQDTVTARDSLEWYDKDQIAVARGDATIVREEKRMRADVVTATVVRDEKGAQHISRIDAQGNVVVTSQDQIGRGDSGVYNVDTGITTLAGHVKLTRGQNELRGQYAVVDMNKNISRLLAAPPSDSLTASSPGRVEGLIMPREQTPQSQNKSQSQGNKQPQNKNQSSQSQSNN
jgi:lipopolysaccharide export system protein LptA